VSRLKSALRYAGLAALLAVVLLGSGYLAMRLVIHGDDVVKVPNLTGSDVMKALEVAAEQKLNVRVEGFEYSPQVPKNHVLFQEPAAGGTIKRGRDLKLVISRGPEVLLGPQLVGLPLPQAAFILEQNALVPGQVARVHSRYARPEVVLAQNPPAQANLRQGQKVDILVSAGPPPQEFVVPDMRGRSAVEAALALESLGLEQGQLSMAWREGHAEGEVMEQRPKPGYRAVRGSKVALLINQREDKLANKENESVVFSYTMPTGLRGQPVKIDLVTAAGTRQLHYGLHDAGDTIQVSFPRVEAGLIVVYVNGAEVLRKRSS
jgi:serine/threonine-protein kinase